MTEPFDDPDALLRATRQFESRRRFERLPHSSADLISKLIARRGFTQELSNDALQRAWQRVVGEPFAGKTRATLVRRGNLEVLVNSSPALQQLGFVKKQILEDLQRELPDSGIRGLRFRVGPLHF
jgi:predicted nucleic acid-binding Zn ribbon protein